MVMARPKRATAFFLVKDVEPVGARALHPQMSRVTNHGHECKLGSSLPLRNCLVRFWHGRPVTFRLLVLHDVHGVAHGLPIVQPQPAPQHTSRPPRSLRLLPAEFPSAVRSEPSLAPPRGQQRSTFFGLRTSPRPIFGSRTCVSCNIGVWLCVCSVFAAFGREIVCAHDAALL